MQFVRRLLRKHKLVFLPRSCFPRLDRAITGNKVLVTFNLIHNSCLSCWRGLNLFNFFAVTPPAPLQQGQCSCEVLQAHGSSSSLHSVPLSRRSSPSPSSLSLTSDPVRPQPSAEAMLAEIAQLSRQNELIRAQLNQAKDLRSGGTGPPVSVNERRESSPVSTGRITPQSAGGRRTFGSSCTSRSQNVQSPEETLSQQVSSMLEHLIHKPRVINNKMLREC